METKMIQFDLSGRTAIVTGGAKGIGLGIAQRWSQAGAAVAIWDRNPISLNYSDFATVEPVDVTNWESIETALDRPLKKFEHVDILVNNAGVNGPTVPTWEYPLDAWDKVRS